MRSDDGGLSVIEKRLQWKIFLEKHCAHVFKPAEVSDIRHVAGIIDVVSAHRDLMLDKEAAFWSLLFFSHYSSRQLKVDILSAYVEAYLVCYLRSAPPAGSR